MSTGASYTRGVNDCHQDSMENCPFASVGGPDKRDEMTVPDYIEGEKEREVYLSGYRLTAKEIYGEDWQTCEFSWHKAMVLEGKSDMTKCPICNEDLHEHGPSSALLQCLKCCITAPEDAWENILALDVMAAQEGFRRVSGDQPFLKFRLAYAPVEPGTVKIRFWDGGPVYEDNKMGVLFFIEKGTRIEAGEINYDIGECVIRTHELRTDYYYQPGE